MKMEGETMSPADGATLPSYGGTCRPAEVLGTYMCSLSIVGHQVLGTGGLSSGEKRVIPLGFCSRGLFGGLIVNHYPTEFHFPTSSLEDYNIGSC